MGLQGAWPRLDAAYKASVCHPWRTHSPFPLAGAREGAGRKAGSHPRLPAFALYSDAMAEESPTAPADSIRPGVTAASCPPRQRAWPPALGRPLADDATGRLPPTRPRGVRVRCRPLTPLGLRNVAEAEQPSDGPRSPEARAWASEPIGAPYAESMPGLPDAGAAHRPQEHYPEAI